MQILERDKQPDNTISGGFLNKIQAFKNDKDSTRKMTHILINCMEVNK